MDEVTDVTSVTSIGIWFGFCAVCFCTCGFKPSKDYPTLKAQSSKRYQVYWFFKLSFLFSYPLRKCRSLWLVDLLDIKYLFCFKKGHVCPLPDWIGFPGICLHCKEVCTLPTFLKNSVEHLFDFYGKTDTIIHTYIVRPQKTCLHLSGVMLRFLSS
jgi:hypothetical protein